MKIDWSFVKGSAVVGVGNMVARVLGLLFFVILTWIYTPTEYGYIRYVIAIATLSCAAASTGFPSAITRYLGRYGKDEELRDAYFSNSLIAIFVIFLATTLVLFTIGKLNFGTFLVMIGLTIAPTYLGAIRGFILSRRIAGFQISTGILKIVIVALLFYVVGVYPLLYALAAFGFACLIPICIIEIIRPLPLHFRKKLISKNVLKELTRFALPVIISSIIYSMMMSIDIICIQHFLGFEQVGFYSVARTLVVVFTFAPAGINMILMPKVAGLREKEKIVSYLKFSLIVIAIASVALLMVIYALGEQLIEVIFTSAYLEALPALFVLSIGMSLFAVYTIIDAVWTGIGRPFIPTKVLLVAVPVNVVGNIFFIPRLGIFGGGLAFSISYLIALILISIITFRNLHKRVIL
ncbi:MAG: oligosaccharide flippase family protein [Nanoarchaeota archaeon]|nr:oligosaccharide flippase family protein [Nanoarchaeota archaeon]